MVAMIFVPFLASAKNFRFDMEQRNVFRFGFLWLIGQTISNFINKSDSLEAFKNIAQILVLLCLLYWGFYWSKKNSKILLYFLWGYLISSIPQFLILPGLYGKSEPWKFIFGPAITLMVLVVIPRFTTSKTSTILLMCPFILVDFLLGARSLGLITLFSVFTVLKVSLKQKGLAFSFFFLVIITCSAGPLYLIYANVASSGSLGEAQQEKFIRQTTTGPLLLVGRSELIYEISAIGKAGLLGLGSSPMVNNDYLQGVALEEFKFGVNHKYTSSYEQYVRNGKIPSHSMLFGAWMEAGLFGALFWLYLTWLVVKYFYSATGREPSIGLANRYLSVNFLWAVLFSPLGAGSRMLVAITFTLIMQIAISEVRLNESKI